MADQITHARLACGCEVRFAPGVEGSPVTLILARKAGGCPMALHVSGQPIYDHREALRPATRPLPVAQTFEEN